MMRQAAMSWRNDAENVDPFRSGSAELFSSLVSESRKVRVLWLVVNSCDFVNIVISPGGRIRKGFRRRGTAWEPGSAFMSLPAAMSGCSASSATGLGFAPSRWTSTKLSHEVSPMPKTHPVYAPEFRRQMVELVRIG